MRRSYYYVNVLYCNKYIVCIPIVRPTAPLNVMATNITSTNIHLSWEQPSYDGGARVTNYVITHHSNAEDHVTISTDNTELTRQLDGLAPFTAYQIQISAENIVGIGPASATVNVTTLVGGTLIHDYYMHMFVMLNLCIHTTQQSCSIASFLLSMYMDLYVLCVYVCLCIILDIHCCYVIFVAPSAPRSLNITASTGSSVTLSWMPPDPPNGPLSIYQATYNEEGSQSDPTTTLIISTTFPIRSLQSNVVYIIHVRASTVSETNSLIFGAPATLRIMNGI